MKKVYLSAMLLAALLGPGCSWFHHGQATGASNTLVTPDMSLEAKVVDVDDAARFVVLSFPEDKMPKLQQTLFIYRSGMKIAEVRVTGPKQEHNIVADLVTGEPKVGDTVRSD